MGSNIPKIGNTDIAGCYLGSTEISKMYIGDTLIYGSDEPAASNNFRMEVADSNFSVVDGTLEDFVSGDGYAQLRALSSPTYPSFNLYIDNSSIDFSMVKTVRFKRTEVSLHQNLSWNSNYGYYDSNNTWHFIAQNPSPVDGVMTFDNLSMPSDTTRFQFGCNSYVLETNGEYKLEEFDVLDANGNSILKS